jgi:HAD superfamily hydrolase (TIGR01490 family)
VASIIPKLARMEAAFFDLDKTVIAKASMVAFSRSLYREGMISRSTILRALWGQLVYLHLGASDEKLARMRESVLKLTKGWEQARIREIVAETLEEIVQPIIYAEALELIEAHQAAGRRVFIVSASPVEIVEPLGRYLGVDEAIASHARLDDEGRYTGEMHVYAYGPYKADIMRQRAAEEGLDLAASYAYSDSYTDVPMLEAVGHPVAVNPDRVLLKLARDRDWEVRQFVRPVRLRTRVSAPPPGPTAAVGGMVMAAVAGGVLWWKVRHRPPPPPPPRRMALVRVSRRAASWRRRQPARQGWRARGASS